MRTNHLLFLCLMFMFNLASTSAGAGSALQVSSAGLGEAKFGMTVESVEKALGQKLSFSKQASKVGVYTLACTYAAVDGLLGVSLRFENGRFTAVDVQKPTVITKSGFKVGDPESAVINKLRSDSTYQRHPNHYDDNVDEITVGKAKFTEKAKYAGQWQGTVVKFTSENGVITSIEAGEASYVYLVEHHEECP